MAKPDRGIFEIALGRLGVTAEDAVMVGDSWANDVAGAVGAGIRAVWFNPARIPMPPRPRGVAEIHALGPLDEVLPLLVGALPRSR